MNVQWELGQHEPVAQGKYFSPTTTAVPIGSNNLHQPSSSRTYIYELIPTLDSDVALNAPTFAKLRSTNVRLILPCQAYSDD
jgi:hypothetical protein